jgi:hypothetical protein
MLMPQKCEVPAAFIGGPNIAMFLRGRMTVGWILEGDRDRFLAAREVTPETTPGSQTFQCPFCKASFGESNALNVHIESSHVIKRPFLLISGIEPGREDTIRVKSSLRSLEIFNCAELGIALDGEPIQSIRPARLAGRLSSLKWATVRLRLANTGDGLAEPVVHEYQLRVIIPDESSLAKIDELFVAELGVDDVDLDKVGSFYQATRSGATAEYAEALADYVRAVLIKDGDPRTGISTLLHHYHEIQNRALNTLQAFERPLATLLSALIRFGLNDFSMGREATGFADLDHAYSVLGPLAQDGQTRAGRETSMSATTNARVFVCPVDAGTDTVTGLARQAAVLARWGSAAEERFSALAEHPSIDPLDRAKIRALWAVTALRLGASQEAQRALRLLDCDPTFGDWTAGKLAGVE